ncbi:ExbD/TolR family protein [Bordetella tumulicola]|uniref:ExbD/TolR family protein n=1 Tax=Bordetella tumulicola TaxID=1649133 RepID=UPI0039EE11A6
MAFGSFDNKSSGSHAVSEINMVPLIDVMLVLLVIFIITAPLMAHSVRINMPQVSSEPIDQEPKTVDLAIDAAGALFWDDKPVAIDDLPNRFFTMAQAKPQPELRIRADLNTRYETLAKVMAAARRSGLSRIGFITTPAPNDAATAPAAAAGGTPANEASATGSPAIGASTPGAATSSATTSSAPAAAAAPARAAPASAQ